MNPNQVYKYDNHSDVSPNVILVAENSDLSNEDVVELVDNRNSETSVLEKKLDRINDMLLEQQNILKSLVDGGVIYKCSKTLQSKDPVSGKEAMSCSSQKNNSDRSLLDDIVQQKQAQSFHQEFKVTFETFLQSEELKNYVAKSTADVLKSEINRSLSETLEYCFSSMSESYHERLLDSVTDVLADSFYRLVDDSYLIGSVEKASRSIWLALTKHQTLMASSQPPHNVMKKLQENLESILKRELAESKKSFLNLLKSQAAHAPNFEKVQYSIKNCMPIRPPQPCWNTEEAQNPTEDMSLRQSQLALSPENANDFMTTSTSKDFVTPKDSKSELNLGRSQCPPKDCKPPNPVQPTWKLKDCQYPAGNKESPGSPAHANDPPEDKASISCGLMQKPKLPECSTDVSVRSAEKPLVSNPEQAQYPMETNEPPSSSQPANLLHTSFNSQACPKGSILEKLFKAAHIRAMIEKGDVEESFSEALGSHDLSLVEGACRAADPQRVFAAPCCLRQPTLLSLVQQLSTDVTQDTHLKCQYIEECIINLDKTNPTTRVNLPLIVGEVRKHLSNFLLSNPGHPLSGRITLIVMAADNLLL